MKNKNYLFYKETVLPYVKKNGDDWQVKRVKEKIKSLEKDYLKREKKFERCLLYINLKEIFFSICEDIYIVIFNYIENDTSKSVMEYIESYFNNM